jgi:predicted kinase
MPTAPPFDPALRLSYSNRNAATGKFLANGLPERRCRKEIRHFFAGVKADSRIVNRRGAEVKPGFPGRAKRISLARPLLILVMGVAGSGKTTLAKQLVRNISTIYLDNNHIADAFFPATRNSARYEGLRPCFYKALYTIAAENLKLGNSVLLDVPHVKEVQSQGWREWMVGLARSGKATMIVIKCFCSEPVLKQRLRTRGERRDRWKLTHWRAFLREQPIDFPVPFDHLVVNTEEELTANVRTAVDYIVSGGQRRSTD